MNEVNENVTVNGAGTQDEEPAAKNNETKARSSSVLENTA